MRSGTLLTFGRTDPHNLSWKTVQHLRARGETGLLHVCVGPEYKYSLRPFMDARNVSVMTAGYRELAKMLRGFKTVYCGTGATMLEAVAAGCTVMVLSHLNPIDFAPVWTCLHYDHNMEECPWYEVGVLAEMAKELRWKEGE
jgi:spore coat polysaccharide biosynthesis predicted glycosyltransferase SpsG